MIEVFRAENNNNARYVPVDDDGPFNHYIEVAVIAVLIATGRFDGYFLADGD